MMKSVIAGFMLLTGVGTGAALYTLSKLFALDPGERYNVLRFREDRLTIGYGLFAPTYKLNDIAEVRFSKSPARGRVTLGGYTGDLQVVIRQHAIWCVKEYRARRE